MLAHCLRILMVFSWYSHGILMVFSWYSHGVLLVFSSLFSPGSASLTANRSAAYRRDQGIGQLHLPSVFPTVHYLSRANEHARDRGRHARRGRKAASACGDLKS